MGPTTTKELGAQIRSSRELLGWTQRKLGSKLGYTTREVRALEAGIDPKPRKERREYMMKFIPFLGYAVRTYTDWPVRNTLWDTRHEQTKVIKKFNEAFAVFSN